MSNNVANMNANSSNQESQQGQQGKEANSVILKLEMLTSKYDTTLIKYQQAAADYIHSMKQTNPSFAVIPGSVYWGSGTLETIPGQQVTKSTCMTSCAKTKGCSGATFNPDSNGTPTCFLRTGDGSLIPSSSSNYAIVPLSKSHLLNMQSLNQQLSEINQQIMEIVETQGDAIYKSEEMNRASQNKELQKNYKKLVKDRTDIEEKLNRFQDLDGEKNNSDLKTNANYSSYLLLMLLAILCFVVLFNVSALFGSNNSSSSSSSYSDDFAQFGGRMGNKVGFIGLAIVLLFIVAYYYRKSSF